MKNKRFVVIGIIICFMVPVIYYFKLDEISNDETVEIGITIDGEYIDTFPEKNPEVRMKEIVCDHGASGVWYEDNWSFSVTNLEASRTKCSIHF